MTPTTSDTEDAIALSSEGSRWQLLEDCDGEGDGGFGIAAQELGHLRLKLWTSRCHVERRVMW